LVQVLDGDFYWVGHKLALPISPNLGAFARGLIFKMFG